MGRKLTEEEKAAREAAKAAIEAADAEKETGGVGGSDSAALDSGDVPESTGTSQSGGASLNGRTENPPDSEDASGLLEQNELLRAQIALLQQQLDRAQTPQVIAVSSDSEKVHFLWQAEVAPENVQQFGEGGMYGRIVGRTGSFYVPKNDLSRILDEKTRWMLDQRWLIVVSGLTDEERTALGVNYREGELLDQRAFAKMIDLGDELIALYPELCEGHRRMVAQRCFEAFEAGNPNVTRARVTALNDLSKQAGSTRGDFIAIIEEMNRRDAG